MRSYRHVENTMRIASEIILSLSNELECAGSPWPHPWDHYPFRSAGKCIWLRYQDLDPGQREQIRHAITQIKMDPARQPSHGLAGIT
jgi:hypothetical protein